MNAKLIRIAIFSTLLAAGCILSCSAKAEEPTEEATFEIATIHGVPKLTEAKLQAFEEKYDCELPADYRRVMLLANGGIPIPDCITFREDGRDTATDVYCLHSIGDERPWASMEWHLETFEGRIPKDTIPIGHDACGNLWLMKVSGENQGTVVFWDHGSFDTLDETDFDVWPKVAKNFTAFLDELHEYEKLPHEDDLLSRYALVQSAIESMAKSSPDFMKHSNPDHAWHFHYAGEQQAAGSVKMQLVAYQVHAAVPHTDGYSHMRSEKGLIEKGPTRRPE